MTHGPGTPAAKARASICWANCGVVAKPRSAGMPACRAALPIARPFLGQIEFPIQQDLAQRAGRAQKDADLAVGHVPDRATILAGDASRVPAGLEKPGVVEDQHAVGIPHMLHALGAQLVPDGVSVPIGAAQPILEAIGRRLAADCRHLPAVLALDFTEQTAQICQDPVAGLRAGGNQAPAVGPCLPCRPGRLRSCWPSHPSGSNVISHVYHQAVPWFRPPAVSLEPISLLLVFVTTVVLGNPPHPPLTKGGSGDLGGFLDIPHR